VGLSVSNGVAERSGRTSGRVESGAQTARRSLQVPGHVSFALTHPQALRSMVRAGPGSLGAASCAGLGYDEPQQQTPKPPKPPNKGA
jgi:hypothetical protein